MSSAHASPNASLPVAPLPGRGARWALLLDVDGTLLDFSDDPASVAAPRALTVLLHDLHAALDGALGLISGRTIGDLDRIVGHARWPAAGLHGLELRHANGSYRRGNVSAVGRARMRMLAGELAARFEGVQIEDKQQALALHCRNDPGKLEALREAAASLLPQLPDYELQPGRQVVEFRPVGVDKGEAVRQLLAVPPFAGRVPVYVGDDLTDEHAFKQINCVHGISVRAGSRVPTLAQFSLADPAAVRAWLQRVLNAISHGDSSHVGLPHGIPPRQP
ncbi:MAG TPA: trehalose-phosphatase [Rhodanobacter sp.]|jgi:trehalose 6-phosphate phosphatase|nr:trehalose-phosphatase [Rhodanobacter sp.]